jgi:hypothetical protein
MTSDIRTYDPVLLIIIQSSSEVNEAEIAETFDLPLPAVYAAMAYYFEHNAEIDVQDALVDELKAHYPSKLESTYDE